MLIHCVSDLHGNIPQVPTCDLLLLAGDYWGYGYSFGTEKSQAKWLKHHLVPWIKELKNSNTVSKIVAIAGNHDGIFQTHPELVPEIDWIYLKNSTATIDIWGEDIKVYGTPYTPFFLNWAFNAPEGDYKEIVLGRIFNEIPEGIDILLSHGPAYMICDRTYQGDNVGSKELAKALDRVKPKMVVCGHIHTARNVIKHNETLVVSCSIVKEGHKIDNNGITLQGNNLNNMEVISY